MVERIKEWEDVNLSMEVIGTLKSNDNDHNVKKSKRFLSLKFIDLHRSFKIELKHTYGIHTKRHKDPLLPNSLANRGGQRKI